MIPQCIDQGVGSSRGARWPGACWPATGPGRATAHHPVGHRRRSPTTSTASPPTSTSSSGWPRWPAERKVPPAQVALAWLLQRPGVTAPIVGATKPTHLADALAAEQLELTDDEMARAGGALRSPPGTGPLLSPMASAGPGRLGPGPPQPGSPAIGRSPAGPERLPMTAITAARPAAPASTTTVAVKAPPTAPGPRRRRPEPRTRPSPRPGPAPCRDLGSCSTAQRPDRTERQAPRP